jgi:hypothetical protein
MVSGKKDIILSLVLLMTIAASMTCGYSITDFALWLLSEQVIQAIPYAMIIILSVRYKYLFPTAVFAFAMWCSHTVHMAIKAPYNVIVGHSVIGFLSIIVAILVQKFTTNKRTTK